MGAVVAALVLPAWPAAGQDQPILPGYWESQNRVSFPFSEDSTSRQCVTAEQVRQFISGPATKNVRCTYARSRVAGGLVDAAGECTDRNGMKASIAVKGGYTQTSFTLDAELRVNIGGVPIPISASTRAQRIADTCPAEGAEPASAAASPAGAPEAPAR